MAHSNTIRYAGRLAPKYWAPKLTLRLALSEIATCSTLSITRAQRRHVLVQLEGLSLRVGLLVLLEYRRVYGQCFSIFLFNIANSAEFPSGRARFVECQQWADVTADQDESDDEVRRSNIQLDGNRRHGTSLFLYFHDGNFLSRRPGAHQ